MNPIRNSIGYADVSWNPVTGCRHGCTYCYARRIVERFMSDEDREREAARRADGIVTDLLFGPSSSRERRAWPVGFEPTLHVQRLDEPKRSRKPYIIFTVDMGDLFGAWVPSIWIESVLKTIRACPQHRFLLLTKNPSRYAGFDAQGEWVSEFKFPANVWLGTTVTGPADADRISSVWTIWHDVGAWISYEPALGPFPIERMHLIDWLVIGAQERPRAVPPNPKWISEAIAAARANDVAVFVKNNVHWPERIREYPEGLVIGA